MIEVRQLRPDVRVRSVLLACLVSGPASSGLRSRFVQLTAPPALLPEIVVLQVHNECMDAASAYEREEESPT